jgi:hypothetical protein
MAMRVYIHNFIYLKTFLYSTIRVSNVISLLIGLFEINLILFALLTNFNNFEISAASESFFILSFFDSKK